LAHRAELSELLDAIFMEQPVAHWQALLEGHVPVAPVHELGRALDNPWLETIGMRDTVSHPDMAELHVLSSPIKVDGARLPNKAGPLLGQDSDDVLAEIGYDADSIAHLRQSGVI
jgi:crotonobetainyl-CoA:carnitine CoA-transferase CaiB-like acyl-CoA transferase